MYEYNTLVCQVGSELLGLRKIKFRWSHNLIMATQNFNWNLFLNLYREGGKYNTSLFPPASWERNVWHLQPVSSVWRPLAFPPVTLSTPEWVAVSSSRSSRPREWVCPSGAPGRLFTLRHWGSLLRDSQGQNQGVLSGWNHGCFVCFFNWRL